VLFLKQLLIRQQPAFSRRVPPIRAAVQFVERHVPSAVRANREAQFHCGAVFHHNMPPPGRERMGTAALRYCFNVDIAMPAESNSARIVCGSKYPRGVRVIAGGLRSRR
jgi:hypothetical protein